MTLLLQGVMRDLFAKSVPPPPQYVGLWSSSDGQNLTILPSGRGSYNGRSGLMTYKIDNGLITVDPAHSSLNIHFSAIGRTFHIDQPPAKGSAEMVLDGTRFNRVQGR